MIVSEFDSRGVGERPGSAHGLARRGLGPCGADLPVDHRRGADFAPAYIGLVRLKNSEHLVLPGLDRSEEVQQQALELSKVAVEVDPFDARAHHCFAWSLALGRRFDQAELSFGLALELNENDPWTLISSALGTAYCGKHREALELADQALRIDPNPSRAHWGYQAKTRFLCEDYTGSVTAAARALNVLPFLSAWHAAALGTSAIARTPATRRGASSRRAARTGTAERRRPRRRSPRGCCAPFRSATLPTWSGCARGCALPVCRRRRSPRAAPQTQARLAVPVGRP